MAIPDHSAWVNAQWPFCHSIEISLSKERIACENDIFTFLCHLIKTPNETCSRRLHFLDMAVRFWINKSYIHGSKGKVHSTDLSGGKLALCKNDLEATGLSSAGLFRSNLAIHHWRQKSLPIFTSDMCPPAGMSFSWYR